MIYNKRTRRKKYKTPGLNVPTSNSDAQYGQGLPMENRPGCELAVIIWIILSVILL